MTVRWLVDTGNTRSGSRREGRWRPATAPAPTITTRADQLELRDGRPGRTLRRLAIADAGALQGFPHAYPWAGDKGEQLRQVGNATPPPLARAVLACLA